jgi:hypothetical protein
MHGAANALEVRDLKPASGDQKSPMRFIFRKNSLAVGSAWPFCAHFGSSFLRQRQSPKIVVNDIRTLRL